LHIAKAKHSQAQAMLYCNTNYWLLKGNWVKSGRLRYAGC